MKNLKSIFAISALLIGTTSAFAASHAGAPAMKDEAKKEMPMAMSKDMPAAASKDMTDGEIRKVDKDNKKITIKHGEIKNLDMPGMTMVFQVKDPAVLDKLKSGDKVRFSAEKVGGAIVVTDIQPVN